MAARILIVEDESSIHDLLTLSLQQAGYDVSGAVDVSGARTQVREQNPDLILLDWMLPGTSGIDFARELKADSRTRSIPIIMLTARAEEEDKLKVLEMGADDYITKPFSPREVATRIKVVLRRLAPQRVTDPVEVAGLSLDPASHRVVADGQEVDLGPTEFRMLHFLMTHPERVYSRSQLLDFVWGEHVVVEERTVDVHVRRLRAALEPSGHATLIQTVRGAGYRFSSKPM